MIKYVGNHLLGRIILALVPWIWPISKKHAKGSFGNINFYGPKDFVEECLKAMNDDLSIYDERLKNHFLKGQISLCFYYEEKHYFIYPSVGLYTIPEKIYRYRGQGICQYVVYRYFQSCEIGLGLSAALKENTSRRRDLMIGAKKRMKTWLAECNYPAGWIDCYN